MEEDFVLLRGNHEDYLLNPKLTLMQRFVWERVGRGTTVASFKAHGDRMENTIPWLDQRCQMYYQGDGFQCVHAGLLVDPIEANDPQTMIHDHNVVKKNRYAGPLTITGHIALQEPTYFAGDEKTTETLAYGETLPLPETGVICIDTGCGKGGRLTAMIIKDKEYHLESVPE
jgi:serine/threonine protein phosphatase 1